MKRPVLCITFFFVICHYGVKIEADGKHESIVDPDTYRNLTEIIESKGYDVVQNTVQTADGYLLSVQRIPHGRNNFTEQGKEVVLLIHGIANDATIWVINFPGQSLGFVLPDEGYDVWLLNTRGSYYSQSHVKYKTDQYQFWNFSFNEVGQYDIPATIEYILNTTRKETLHIIGYSQGGMSSFSMLSEMPDYNDKVKLLVVLAPVGFLGHSTSVIRLAVPFRNAILFFSKLFTHGELIPENEMTKIFLAVYCSINDVDVKLCENVLFAVGGVDRKQLNETRIDVYISRFLSTTSTKSLVHLLQLVHSKRFRKYDYGRRHNLKYYQQEEPPDYETTRITTPIALISSSNDIIADPTDLSILRRSLNSVVFDYQVPYPYNHFDFVLAENAPKLINEPVLQLLAKY